MKKLHTKHSHFPLSLPTLAGGATVAALVFVLLAVAVNAAPGHLPYRTRLLGQTVSNRPPAEALTVLDAAQSKLESSGLQLSYQGKNLPLAITLTNPSDPGLAVNIAAFDREVTAEQLSTVGHSGNLARDLVDRVRAFYFGLDVVPALDIDDGRLMASLDDLLVPFEHPATNAHYVINGGALTVQPETIGSVFDRSSILAAVRAHLVTLNLSPIPVSLITDRPRVTVAALNDLHAKAKHAVDRGPVTVTFGDRHWTFDTSTIAGWLTAADPRHPGLTLNAETVRKSLAPVSEAVAIPVKNPRFTISNGRVTEFVPAEAGRALDESLTLAGIADALLGSGSTSVAAAATTIEPQGSTGDSNTIGITELVAEGRTNFAGSPTNRRFNIKVGAEKLNGIIIKSGETFSLVKALVPIDAAGGYRQELVIKGDRTIPEFGGGLCQIGTTAFRLIMNSGLPVVERRNHSYRVRYYEPPVGKDATIYDPKPDFRFTNDYKNSLLLTTAIEGDDLVFRFYGTKDGRTNVQTTPRLFNIVSPPVKKTIETTDIPVGTTKCLEHAHPGSDAEFTYSVTYPDGTTKTQVFASHYRPWQEVCLVGVKSLPKPAPAPSTNSNTNSTTSNTNINASNTNSAVDDIPN